MVTLAKNVEGFDMIIVMKPNASQESVAQVTTIIKDCGLNVHLSQGEEVTIIAGF